MTEKRITLDELFARRAAELKADAESPEGRAREARSRERFQRDEAARLEWEAKNPPTAFELGELAAANDEPREAPEGVDAAEWLEGYDQERDADAD